MHRRLFVRGVAVVALLGAAAVIDAPGATAESPPSAVTDLRAAIDTILADSRLTGAQAGVVVVDTTTGETLYDRNGDRRLVPASNTKLLTSSPDNKFSVVPSYQPRGHMKLWNACVCFHLRWHE